MTEAEIRQQFRRALGEGRYPPDFSRVLANRLREPREADAQRRRRWLFRPLPAIAGLVIVLLVAAAVLQLHVHLQNTATSPPKIVPPADTALIAPPTFGPGGLVAIDVLDHVSTHQNPGGPPTGASYLYLSNDGGMHWHRSLALSVPSRWTSAPPVAAVVLSLRFFDSRHAVVLAGADPAVPSALYVTSDGGGSWQQRSLPAQGYFSSLPLVCFVTPSHGWALTIPDFGSDFGLYETVDGAHNWTRLVNATNGLELEKPVTGLACSGTDAIAIADLGSNPPVARVHYSADGGRSWQAAELPSAAGRPLPCFPVLASISANGHGLLGLGPPPSEPAGSGSFIPMPMSVQCHLQPLTSIDGGRTWRGPSDPAVGPVVGPDQAPRYALGFWAAGIAANGWWMLTNDQPPTSTTARAVLATSSDGANWSSKDLTLPVGYHPVAAAFNTLRTGWIVISDTSDPARHDVILATSDGGSTWNQVKTP